MDEIEAYQPQHTYLDARLHIFHAEADEEIAQREQQQTDGLLGGRGGLLTAFVQGTPYGRHEGGQDDNHRGIERLEPGGRHLPSEDVAVGLLGSEEGERSTCLLVSSPEEDDEEGDDVDDQNPLALNLGK